MLPLKMLGVLLLLLSPCDAGNTCPPEINPLTLNPPVVITEYGKNTNVICTNPENSGREMTLVLGNERAQSKVLESFVSITASLTDWNAKGECKIKLDESTECIEEIEIIVYKIPDVLLSVNKQNTGIEKTTYELQCYVFNAAPIQNLTIEWYKNNKIIKETSFSETVRTPVNESSILEIDVSREESIVQFRCEALLNFGPEPRPEPQHPVVSQTLNLSAVDALDFTGNLPTEPGNITASAATPSPEVPLLQVGVPVALLSVKSEKVLSEETNYELQCDVISAPVQNLTVKWYKNNETVDVKGFSDTTSTLVNKSYILEVNVSREEKTAQFRCEAQPELEPPNLVVSQTLSLSALYAPVFLMNHNNYITVHRGANVSLSCEAGGDPPPEYQWTVDDGLDILENSSELGVVKVNRSATYSCRAGNKLGNITLSIQVHVPPETRTFLGAAPGPEPQPCDLTMTPSEVVVKFGDPVVINCSTSSTDLDVLGWESPYGKVLKYPSTVTLNVMKLEDWAFEPFCFGTKQNGNQCFGHPIIRLYKTPDFVSVFSESPGLMKEGSEHRLQCDVHNVAPVFGLKVKWYQGNKTVFTDDLKLSNKTNTPPHKFSSTLTFTPKKSDNGSLFRCEAELLIEPEGPEFVPSAASEPYLAVVLYKPLIKGCPQKTSVVENKFSMNDLSCEIEGNPPPAVKWYREGKLINSYETLNRTDSGTYTAEITNSVGNSSTSVLITVEHSPSFDCKMQYEVEVNEKLKTLCEPKGVPPPTISWFKNGKKATLPERWTKHDSGNYSLYAQNKHGDVKHDFYLDILYAPEFKEENIHKALIPGRSWTFSCSAEGNPDPEIRWTYKPADNLRETSEGRQRIITITGATSTNVGLYICVATNKVGNVTRTVTLAERVRTREIFIWLPILLLILIILLVLYIYFCYRKKRCGRYAFIPTTDRSSLPMTTKSAAGQPTVNANSNL